MGPDGLLFDDLFGAEISSAPKPDTTGGRNHPGEGLKQNQRMTHVQNHRRAVFALMFFTRVACHCLAPAPIPN